MRRKIAVVLCLLLVFASVQVVLSLPTQVATQMESALAWDPPEPPPPPPIKPPWGGEDENGTIPPPIFS